MALLFSLALNFCLSHPPLHEDGAQSQHISKNSASISSIVPLSDCFVQCNGPLPSCPPLMKLAIKGPLRDRLAHIESLPLPISGEEATFSDNLRTRKGIILVYGKDCNDETLVALATALHKAAPFEIKAPLETPSNQEVDKRSKWDQLFRTIFHPKIVVKFSEEADVISFEKDGIFIQSPTFLNKLITSPFYNLLLRRSMIFSKDHLVQQQIKTVVKEDSLVFGSDASPFIVEKSVIRSVSLSSDSFSYYGSPIIRGPLNQNAFAFLGGLKYLPKTLTSLYLYDAGVREGSIIGSLTQLVKLGITFSHLKDITFINSLIHLKEFSCSVNEVESLEGVNVSVLNSLTEFYCNNNKIKSLEGFSFPFLKELMCSDNQITSLKCTFSETLEKLHCSNNQIIDFGDVKTIPSSAEFECLNNDIFGAVNKDLLSEEAITNAFTHVENFKYSIKK